MNKITLTIRNPDKETTDWIAEKLFHAYNAELQKTIARASQLVSQNKSGTIRSKPVVITIEAAP